MNKFIIPLCLLLTSCVRTVYVTTPCPAISLPPEPHYSIYDLHKGDSAGKVSKAYVHSLHQCIGYSRLCVKKAEGMKHE